MALTFIYGDTSIKRPKDITVNSNSSKLNEKNSLDFERMNRILMIYADGGIYTNTGNSYILLSDIKGKSRKKCTAKEASIYINELFKELEYKTRAKVKELHLLSSNSSFNNEKSLAQNLSFSEISKIKETFPYLNKIVGVEGLIDQTDSLDEGIVLTVDGNFLGRSEDITGYGLLSDKVNKELVQEFYVL